MLVLDSLLIRLYIELYPIIFLLIQKSLVIEAVVFNISFVFIKYVYTFESNVEISKTFFLIKWLHALAVLFGIVSTYLPICANGEW